MKAIITRNDQTAVLELPTSRMELAGSLSRIGVRTPAYIIPCSDEEEDYIKVKLFGESDFENELTALVTPKDSLGSVNTMLDLYRELPQTQKEKLKAELSQNPPDSLSSLCQKIMNFQPKYVTEDYYFPLTVSVYEYNEYGDLDYRCAGTRRWLGLYPVRTVQVQQGNLLTKIFEKPIDCCLGE